MVETWSMPALRASPSTFSILERIVVVETPQESQRVIAPLPFSILERIVVVETTTAICMQSTSGPFSILERIVVVETVDSLNGPSAFTIFQYPRTDRGG